MKYTTFLFDWDGCLANTLDIWLNGYRYALKHYGITDVSDAQIVIDFFGTGNSGALKYALDPEEFFTNLYPYIEENLKRVSLYEGASEVVSQLRARGHKVALVSTSMRYVLEPALKHNSLFKSFDTIVAGDDVTKFKPDPEPLFKAIESLGSSLESAVMVGDSDKDILAAQNAGIDSILFFPEYNVKFYSDNHHNSLKPTYTIKSFEEIITIS